MKKIKSVDLSKLGVAIYAKTVLQYGEMKRFALWGKEAVRIKIRSEPRKKKDRTGTNRRIKGNEKKDEEKRGKGKRVGEKSSPSIPSF